jgi:uncharacterized phage protein gp47/JayE
MPWITPTLRKTREMVRDDITASLYGAAFVGNNVLRVMADAMAGLAHHTLRFVDWLALQLLADTAETEWLDRHGQIWLVNADGTVGRKQAAYALGTVTLTGVLGTVVPMGTRLEGNNISYETMQEVVLGEGTISVVGTDVRVRALDAGKAGNAPLTLSVTGGIAGLDTRASVVNLGGGADIENDNDLRTRVLLRIRNPPMGGDLTDYVQWALAVPGVTRAWSSVEMGIGTVTVRFMCDDLRADNDGFPLSEDIDRVKAYLDEVRPVAVKDIFIFGPIPQRIDVYINNLVPDSSTVRAAIEANLLSMLYQKAGPGQTIYAAWKTYAIMDTAEVVSFHMPFNADNVMDSLGHMAVLGDIVYGIEP